MTLVTHTLQLSSDIRISWNWVLNSPNTAKQTVHCDVLEHTALHPSSAIKISWTLGGHRTDPMLQTKQSVVMTLETNTFATFSNIRTFAEQSPQYKTKSAVIWEMAPLQLCSPIRTSWTLGA